MNLTYTGWNYQEIDQDEWLYIANTVARYLTQGEITEIGYEQFLRPTDAALLAIEDNTTSHVHYRFYKMTWEQWRELLFNGYKSALLNHCVLTIDMIVIVSYMQEIALSTAKKTKYYQERFHCSVVRQGTWLCLYCDMLQFLFYWQAVGCHRVYSRHDY